MAARCFLPTSPYKLPDGHFLATLPHQYLPSFGTQSNLASPSALILVAMACCAFQTHYAAPDFYKALRKNDKVLTNFRNLTILGFAGVSLINIAILAFGFLTFGANSQGIILNNYSTKDLGASVCRLLMATSVIGGFPFLISAAKSAFFKLNYDIRCLTNESCERIEPTKATNRLVTQGFVAIVTGLALMLEDAGFVVSFNGALVGSAIVYIFPSVLFLQATKRRLKEGSIQLTRKLRLERYLSRFLVGFGVATGVLGAAVTVLNYFYPGALRQ
jgi:amino acid permease